MLLETVIGLEIHAELKTNTKKWIEKTIFIQT